MLETSAEPRASKLPGLTWLDALLGWLRAHDRTVLLVGVGFQITVLMVMILTQLMILVTGDTVLLRVVPVDPRDLFRGDYVTLSYEFSRVPQEGIPGLEPGDREGRTVYVTLVPEEDGRHWRASGLSLQKPSTGRFLRGRITSRNRIFFGIESYFVQEGEGSTFEDAVRERTLSAEVALDRNGKAVLKRLVID